MQHFECCHGEFESPHPCQTLGIDTMKAAICSNLFAQQWDQLIKSYQEQKYNCDKDAVASRVVQLAQTIKFDTVKSSNVEESTGFLTIEINETM